MSISALFIFGLAIVTYSYTVGGTTSATVAACCCHSGDSCPMKNKGASMTDAKMSAENCPMKNKDASATAAAAGHSCENCSCCGDSCPMHKHGAAGSTSMPDHGASCPMKKKDASSATVPAVAGEIKHEDTGAMKHGEGCCCPCCSGANKTETAAS